MIRVIWCRGRVAKQWRHVEGLWILKEENMSDITQFCTKTKYGFSYGSIPHKLVLKALTTYSTMCQRRLKNSYLQLQTIAVSA